MAVGRISYQTAFAFNQEWITVEFGLEYESERVQDLNRHVNTLSHNPLPVSCTRFCWHPLKLIQPVFVGTERTSRAAPATSV